mmetsp:Transcript_84482/g.192574  ORF Transcript_84482/g.192574 Transcript_84482/m.192574 type:complete len:718 (+) Transcript_84482:38-2191(+)
MVFGQTLALAVTTGVPSQLECRLADEVLLAHDVAVVTPVQDECAAACLAAPWCTSVVQPAPQLCVLRAEHTGAPPADVAVVAKAAVGAARREGAAGYLPPEARGGAEEARGGAEVGTRVWRCRSPRAKQGCGQVVTVEGFGDSRVDGVYKAVLTTQDGVVIFQQESPAFLFRCPSIGRWMFAYTTPEELAHNIVAHTCDGLVVQDVDGPLVGNSTWIARTTAGTVPVAATIRCGNHGLPPVDPSHWSRAAGPAQTRRGLWSPSWLCYSTMAGRGLDGVQGQVAHCCGNPHSGCFDSFTTRHRCCTGSATINPENTMDTLLLNQPGVLDPLVLHTALASDENVMPLHSIPDLLKDRHFCNMANVLREFAVKALALALEESLRFLGDQLDQGGLGWAFRLAPPPSWHGSDKVCPQILALTVAPLTSVVRGLGCHPGHGDEDTWDVKMMRTRHGEIGQGFSCKVGLDQRLAEGFRDISTKIRKACEPTSISWPPGMVIFEVEHITAAATAARDLVRRAVEDWAIRFWMVAGSGIGDGWARWTHSPVCCNRGEAIMSVLHEHRLKRVVEIGVFRGALANTLLSGVPQLNYTGVDPYMMYHEMAYSDVLFWDNLAEETSAMITGLGGRLLRRPSVEAAELVALEPCFDLVFVDGDHSAEAAYADMTSWLPRICPGGWLAGHDFMPPPSGVPAAVHAFLVDYPRIPPDVILGTDMTFFIHIPG